MTEEKLEKLVLRHQRRQAAFMDAGLPSDDAFDLAEAMFERDLDPQDDRRVCFECKHLTGRDCTAILNKFNKPTEPLRFILQRCDKFQLQGK
jgi:hypothetical protein